MRCMLAQLFTVYQNIAKKNQYVIKQLIKGHDKKLHTWIMHVHGIPSRQDMNLVNKQMHMTIKGIPEDIVSFFQTYQGLMLCPVSPKKKREYKLHEFQPNSEIAISTIICKFCVLTSYKIKNSGRIFPFSKHLGILQGLIQIILIGGACKNRKLGFQVKLMF